MSTPDVRITFDGKRRKGDEIKKSFKLLPELLNKKFPEQKWILSETSNAIICNEGNLLFSFKLPEIHSRYHYYEIPMHMHASTFEEGGHGYRVLIETDELWSTCSKLYQMVIDQITTVLKITE